MTRSPRPPRPGLSRSPRASLSSAFRRGASVEVAPPSEPVAAWALAGPEQVRAALRRRRWRILRARLARPVAWAVVAVLAVVAVRGLASPRAPARSVTLWVATRDLPAGATVTRGELRQAVWPLDLVPQGAWRRPRTGVLTSAVARGEPLNDVRLASGGLAGQRAGQVAVTFPVPRALAAVLRPGDRLRLLGSGGSRDGGPGISGDGWSGEAPDGTGVGGAAPGGAAPGGAAPGGMPGTASPGGTGLVPGSGGSGRAGGRAGAVGGEGGGGGTGGGQGASRGSATDSSSDLHEDAVVLAPAAAAAGRAEDGQAGLLPGSGELSGPGAGSGADADPGATVAVLLGVDEDAAPRLAGWQPERVLVVLLARGPASAAQDRSP